MTVEYVNDVPWGKAKFWFKDGSIQGQGTIKDEVPGGGWLVEDDFGILQVFK
jgi:antitoxin component YwqK of YwqJK toxin-antitoxin module